MYAPWLPTLLHHLTAGESAVGASGYANALGANRTGAEIIAFQLFGLPEAWLGVLTLGGILLPAPKDEKGRIFLLSLGLALPLGLAFMSAAAGFSLLTHRPMLALLPLCALLAGRVLRGLPPPAYGLAVLFILLNGLTTRGATPPPRIDWWALSAALPAQDGQAVWIEAGLNSYAIYEHLRRDGWPIESLYLALEESVPPPDLPPRLWLVEFAPEQDWRSPLAGGGYAPSAAPQDLGFYQIDRLRLSAFTRP
jgi:hypothetical protein